MDSLAIFQETGIKPGQYLKKLWYLVYLFRIIYQIIKMDHPIPYLE
jgi:hypothetical protein